MQMRMIKQLGRPGLQDAEKVDVAPDKTLVCGHLLERLRRGFKKECITKRLMRTEDIPECRRQRKSGKEIRHGQKPVKLPFQPVFGLISAALRAMAVVARMVGELPGFALGAVVAFSAHKRGPALPDVMEGSPMGRRHPIAILVKIRVPETMEQFGESHLDHIAHNRVNR